MVQGERISFTAGFQEGGRSQVPGNSKGAHCPLRSPGGGSGQHRAWVLRLTESCPVNREIADLWLCLWQLTAAADQHIHQAPKENQQGKPFLYFSLRRVQYGVSPSQLTQASAWRLLVIIFTRSYPLHKEDWNMTNFLVFSNIVTNFRWANGLT